MMDRLFTERKAQAMLLTEGEPFDSNDFIYEIKWDGIRSLVYLEPGMTDIRNKRNKHLNNIYPELINLHHQIDNRCILDGELVVMSNGKPDFYALQRRSLMSDPFKIKVAQRGAPVIFIAYDILFYGDEPLIYEPLIKRKEILNLVVNENESLVISQFIETNGIDFYQLTLENELEGIVAKRKSSVYQQGKRSKDWIKFKVLKDADFVITGVVKEDEKIKSLRLGLYNKKRELMDYGHVALGISRKEVSIILNHLHEYPLIDTPVIYEKEKVDRDVLWMEPKLVCKVQFMMATHHGLRQPTFQGLRDDKEPRECTLDQLK